MKEARRFRIGVLTSGILDEFTKTTCKGIMKEAKHADVDVIVFPGKYLQRDLSANPELMYEYQYNTLFKYPTAENVDALVIVAGSVGFFATEKCMTDWFASYQNIPCVLIAYNSKDYVSVNFDNYQGIKDGLEFMIKHSKCCHFGMIGGNQDNTDARERKETFYSVLHENGFHDEDIVYAEGDSAGRYEKAYCEILDKRPQVDAVFCTNDEVATNFYEEVKRRGLRIGKDISILGYDDTVQAADMAPPLSTVRADSWKLGEEALKQAVNLLLGKEVEKNRRIPTNFVRRASIYVNKNLRQEEENQNLKFESVFYRFIHEEITEEIQAVKEIYDKVIHAFRKIMFQDECEVSDYAGMAGLIDEFIASGALEYADLDRIISILQRIYTTKLDGYSPEKKMKLMDLFFLFSTKMSYALNQQFGKSRKESDDERHEMKLFVQRLLQFEKGTDSSYGTLLQNVGWLGIHDAALYTFERPCIHLESETFVPPETMLLKAVMKNGEVRVLSAYEQSVKMSEIFYNEYYQTQNRIDRVVLPLFHNEVLYGLLVCNLSQQIYVYGEFLINQLSSAVKVIELLHTNEAIQIQLEENLRTLKENNVKLDTISKSDVLTGIYNRRGFYEEAEIKLAELKASGKDALVVYADMNNLKIINDRYGHKEGDESLRMIGAILQEMVKGRGVAGRIGGDEYACILEWDADNTTISNIIKRIYKHFERYNASSDKPYNLTISAGGYVLTADDKLGLSEALQKADERLYTEKLKRSKEVAK